MWRSSFGASSTTTLTPFVAAVDRTMAVTSAATVAKVVLSGRNSTLPASTFEKSRTSLMSRSRCCPEVRMSPKN